MSYRFDLGTWPRKISTRSDRAQLWFDRGLNWTYAYNHEEAVACFQSALKEDAGCAMGSWGIAYDGGPFYNRPWIRYSEAEIACVLPVCCDAIECAVALSISAHPTEQALTKR